MSAKSSSGAIPEYLGMARPDNALRSLVIRAALALAGLIWFGFPSEGDIVMAVPLILAIPKLVGAFLFQFLQTWIISPKFTRFNLLTVGPLILGLPSRKIQFRWNVPTVYAAGYVGWTMTGDTPDFTSIRLRCKRSLLLFRFGLFFTIVVAALGIVLPSPWYLGLLGIFLTVTIVRVVLPMQVWEKYYSGLSDADQSHLATGLKLMPLYEADQLGTLGDREIEELWSVPADSPSSLPARLFLYFVLELKGRHAESAEALKELAGLADSMRRKPITMYPELVASVYHEAAYFAAAYAGDLDYAIRAMAIAGEPYLDSTAYHKAMTAIWIRFGNRPAAATSFALAQKSHSFWRKADGHAIDEIHLNEISHVFATGTLESLTKPGIGPEFFAELERPIFGRLSHQIGMIRLLSTLLPICIVILLPILAWGLQASTPGEFGFARGFGIPAFVLLALASGLFQLRLNDAAEFSREGVAVRSLNTTLWLPWSVVSQVKTQRRTHKVKSLVIDRARLSEVLNTKVLLKQFRIEWYSDIWPKKTLEEAITTKAPFLMNQSDRTRTDIAA